MTEEREPPVEVKEEHKAPVGELPVGSIGIVLILAYLILLSVFLLYSLMQFWPLPTTAGGAAQAAPVTYLLWTLSLGDEVRLLLIVGLAGALGGLVHALRSLYWYVGNHQLMWSWMPMYLLLPFVGTTLGLVFYFVIRGGFFSPQATVQQTSPFAFAALSGLVGLFSEQAVLKLKEVASTLLTPEEKGANHVEPQKGGKQG